MKDKIPYDDYNGVFPQNRNIIGTITTMFGRDSLRHGWKIIEITDTDMKERVFHRYCRVVYRAMRKQYGKEKVQDECLRVFKVFFPLLHKARTTEEYGFDELAKKRTRIIFESWNPKEGSELDTLLGNILNRMDEPFTKEEFIQFCEDCLVVVMRIRKLSNVECFRLMGVEDKDIKTILNSGISKSAAYKLAGNSIVCDVLFHIFRKLFIEPEPDMVKGETIQLQLF